MPDLNDETYEGKYDSVPRIAEYNPATVTIVLERNDDKVLASVHSSLRAFKSAADKLFGIDEGLQGKHASDVVKEYTASEFQEKFGDDYVTLDKYRADAAKAQEVADNRPAYYVGDDDVNLNRVWDWEARDAEIDRDLHDYGVQKQKDRDINLEAETSGAAIAPQK